MNLKSYSAPEAETIPVLTQYNFMTSGADAFHPGGGGYYGDLDVNDIDYLF